MRFFWEITSGRYRDESRRLVREEAIRTGLDTVIERQATQMRDFTQQLIDGRLSLAAWEVQMMQSIKAVHLVGLALGNGGWYQLGQSDFGWVGQRIRRQYRYLRDFAAQLASGKQPLTAQAVARAAMYAAAARATHRAAQRRQAQQRGMDQERNQLGIADHCKGQGSCIEQTRMGWVPIGSLIPPGSRICLANCHCVLIYRRTPIEGSTRGRPPTPPVVGAGQPGGVGSPPGPARQPESGTVERGTATMAVSNKAWSQFSAADYSPAQWFAATLIHLPGASTTASKDLSKLPVREPDGTLNANAVHAAAAVLAGGRGGVAASPDEKRKAARTLIRLYGQVGDSPPDSLKRLAGA